MMATEDSRSFPRLFPYLAVLGLADFCGTALLVWLLYSYGVHKFDVSVATIGGVVAICLLFAFGLRGLAAACVGRFGIRPMTIYGLAAAALSFAAIVNANAVWLLCTAAVVHGISLAIVWGAVLAGLARIATHGQEQRGLRRMFVVEVIAAATAIVTINLVAQGGINLVAIALMLIWIGTVVAAVGGIPEDVRLPPRADDAPSAGWSYITSHGGAVLSSVAGSAALGGVVAVAAPWTETVLGLSHGLIASVAALAGAIVCLAALGIVRWLSRGPTSFAAHSAFALALLAAGLASCLFSRPSGTSHMVIAILAATLAAPGCLAAFATPASEFLGREATPISLPAWAALTSVQGIGLAVGSALTAIIWIVDRPTTAITAVGIMFIFAAFTHAARAITARRTSSS